MSKRDLWEFHECHEAVTRGGIDQPCDRTAVALRIDPEEGHPYPVCARHARNGGSRMVPLADVVRPVVEERNRVAAARDAAVARAEQAEQAVARVRALADNLVTGPQTSRLATAWDIRRALDGPAEPQEQP